MPNKLVECAPGAHDHHSTGTCFSKKQLLQMADILRIPNAREMSSRRLGRVVTKMMQAQGMSEEGKRPKKPDSWVQDEFKWLNSLDVNAVMRQYENAYKSFRFAGVFPRDFAILKDESGKCIVEDMCNFDASKILQNGKVNRIGMVINLDPYGKRGSHWVALMIDNERRKGIYYYDSTAAPPHEDILIFMQNARNVIRKNLKIRLDMDYNKVDRQKEDTECGVYCLAFLTLMLETGLTFEEICWSMPNDAQIHLLRDVFYRTEEETHVR